MNGDQLTQHLQAFVDDTDILTHKIPATVPDSAFLLGLSRKVQSSMVGIIGMLDLARQDHFSESVNECLHTAHTFADNLMKMMNHITDLHSMERGNVRITPQDCSLSEILLDVDHQMYDHMVEWGGIFFMTMHQDVPTHIRIDPGCLTQCLLTLIKSTTQELKSDLVMLGIGSQEPNGEHRLTLDISHQRNCQCTCERDCACQAYWQRVNAVLNQDRATLTRPDSADLGLVVARQLAVLLGGRLSLESSPLEPLCLSLAIPCPVVQTL